MYVRIYVQPPKISNVSDYMMLSIKDLAGYNHILLVHSVLEELRSGEFGVVNLGLWSNGSADPVQVAVKTLNSQCSESAG